MMVQSLDLGAHRNPGGDVPGFSIQRFSLQICQTPYAQIGSEPFSIAYSPQRRRYGNKLLDLS
jgi:hypothetical protein